MESQVIYFIYSYASFCYLEKSQLTKKECLSQIWLNLVKFIR